MNKLFVSLLVVLSALLSGCAGMNLAGGAIGKSGGAFISADGRGMQRAGYYGSQPVMMQGGQPIVYGGQPVAPGYPYGTQPMVVYQGQMQYPGYPVAGQPMYQGGGYGGGVYTAPCQPYNADGLMAWAQGAGGGSTHSRSASVSNSNGHVNCYSSESASSSNMRPATTVPLQVVR